MIKEFTASVYIIENQKVLLIYHPKLLKWLPPGGHVEANETPAEAARREVREETGLDIEFLTQENVWVGYWSAHSFERPYLCLLEEIPAHAHQPAHQHMDFVYVARPALSSPSLSPPSLLPSQWFSLDQIEQLQADVDIFCETQHILRHLLSGCHCPQESLPLHSLA